MIIKGKDGKAVISGKSLSACSARTLPPRTQGLQNKKRFFDPQLPIRLPLPSSHLRQTGDAISTSSFPYLSVW